MRISLRIITLLSTIVFVDLRCASLLEAQPENSTNIPAEAEERIRDIYERNRYQPRRVQAEWLPDSSGFLGRDLESGAKNTSRNFYDVSTGTSSEPTSEQLASLPESQQVAPNRSWKIETKYRELSLRSLEETSTSGTGKVRTLYKASADRDVRIRETSWSPDGKFVLFLESDMTNVPIRQVLISDDPSYPRLENHRFARVGETIESLRVGFVPAEGGDVTWLDLKTPENGQYLGQIGWAGNSEEILIEKFSRFRDAREVILYRLDGSSTTIYSETSESWLESSQGKISGITWIRNGDAFIVISEKDGWRHAYLHARDGSELAILTPGDYDVIDRAVVDESNQFYYFYASPENGTQKYLYRVPLDGSGELERVTPNEQPGTHQYQFSPNARWAIHTYSTLDFPPVVELVELLLY